MITKFSKINGRSENQHFIHKSREKYYLHTGIHWADIMKAAEQ